MTDSLTPESMYAAMKRASDELAYLNAPVECRASPYGLSCLRLMFARPSTPPTPLDLISGLRVIVDPELPNNRIEFRDRDGKVTYAIDLP